VTHPGRNWGRKKSGVMSDRLVPGPRGGMLKQGGTHPRPGRPSNEFKARMAALADRAAKALMAADILEDVNHPLFMEAAKWAADRGYGRSSQVIAGDLEQPLTIWVVRE